MSTNEQVQTLIKGIPDWNETINQNNTILATAIDSNSNKIGTLTGNGLTETDLATAIKNDRTQLSEITNKQGDITQLNTTDKSSVVNAIKEVKSQANINQSNIVTNTANIATHTSQISSLASGAPKAVSLVTNMTDTTKNYVYTGSESGYTAGNWYYYNGSAWASGGMYQSTGIANDEIDKAMLQSESVLSTKLDSDFTALFENTGNMFDKAATTSGYYYGNAGTKTSATNYYYSSAIPVMPLSQIQLKYYSELYGSDGIILDKNKNFLKSIASCDGYTKDTTNRFIYFTVPSNGYYIITNIFSIDNLPVHYVYLYDLSNIFKGRELPKYKLKGNYVEQAIKDNNTNYRYISDELVATNNLFDYNSRVDGQYCNGGTVTTYNGLSYIKIPVKRNTSYVTPTDESWLSVGSVFDSSGNYIYNTVSKISDDGTKRIFKIRNSDDVSYMLLNFSTSKALGYIIAEGTTLPSTYLPKKTINKNDKLYNKIALFSGDSVCYGANWRTNAIKLTPQDNTGWGAIIKENNPFATCYGYGIGGTCIAKISGRTDSILERLSVMESNADYIIFQGGVNDVWNSVPLGTMTDAWVFDATLDETTFSGALESLFKQALLKWKGKKIGFITTHNIATAGSLGNYMTRAKAICEKWGIPCLDLFYNIGTCVSLPDINALYMQNGDYTHPNEAFYRAYYAPKIEAWMRSM